MSQVDKMLKDAQTVQHLFWAISISTRPDEVYYLAMKNGPARDLFWTSELAEALRFISLRDVDRFILRTQFDDRDLSILRPLFLVHDAPRAAFCDCGIHDAGGDDLESA